MLYDYLFIGSNLFLLFSPVIFYFLNEYSRSLQKSLGEKSTEDDKKFHTFNTRFHILFRIVFVLIALFSISQLSAVLLLNNELIKSNNLIKVDFSFFTFTFLQSVFLITNLILIVFSFLYFRFKPNYRHYFIQELVKVFSIILLIGGLVGLSFYFFLVKDITLPELLTYSSASKSFSFIDLNFSSYSPLVVLFIIYTYAFRLFSKNRNQKTSKFYFISYALTLLMILFLFVGIGLKYFDLFGIGSSKHILFHYSTFYAGLALTYLIVLSFFGGIFSIFIYTKKVEFIGSQFAINYILKLARLNYYSTLGLLLLSFVPWVMFELYGFL